MKYLAAYCLATLAEKQVTAKDIQAILDSVGCDHDDDSIKRVIESMKGKQLHQVISAGLGKVSSISFGSGGGAVKQDVGKKEDVPKQQKEKEKEKKKEEAPKKEEAEEENLDMGDLFGF